MMLAVAVVIHCILFINTVKSVIVNTSIGAIEGIELDGLIDGVKVNLFSGIPYAKPPINELRFASPQPITESIGNLSNPFQANILPWTLPICQGITVTGQSPITNVQSEDCLFLAIFAPSNAKYKETNYTVMIWIHGGGYQFGAGLIFDPTNFVSYIEDIIIITFNYRLATLGFLYDNTFNTGLLYSSTSYKILLNTTSE